MIVKCNLFYTILFWKTFNDTLLVGSMTWPLLLKCCTKKIQDKALPFAQQLLTLFLFFAHFVRRVALNGCFLLKKVWSKYKHEPTGTARRFNMCCPLLLWISARVWGWCPKFSTVIGAILFDMVLQIACEQILERLKPYKMKNPKGNWEDWVSKWGHAHPLVKRLICSPFCSAASWPSFCWSISRWLAQSVHIYHTSSHFLLLLNLRQVYDDKNLLMVCH